VHPRTQVSGRAIARAAGCRQHARSNPRRLPYLEPEDIDEALQYAALLPEDETVELAR
jgi:hypothetical protein